MVDPANARGVVEALGDFGFGELGLSIDGVHQLRGRGQEHLRPVAA